MLLLLNEHRDTSSLFPNLSSYNINNQLAKFEKNLSVGSISVDDLKEALHIGWEKPSLNKQVNHVNLTLSFQFSVLKYPLFFHNCIF